MNPLTALHTARGFRDLARRLWGAEIVFADAQGRFDLADFQAPAACQAALANPDSRRTCFLEEREFVKRALQAGSKEVLESRCHAGNGRFAVAITVGGSTVGVLLAGALPQSSSGASQYKERLQGLRELAALIAEETGRLEVDADTRSQRIFQSQGQSVESRHAPAIIGASPNLRRVVEWARSAASSKVPILITGASGTGKDLIARLIHAESPRRTRPWVVQNCAALQDNLLESELFGHVRGAFTGAFRNKPGLLETAAGGTFFLDEVAEMSPGLQAKLLRFLQEGTFYAVGGTLPKNVDVRVIAATHQPLEKRVAEGSFRADLFYRLNVLRIEMPALCERAEDIGPLCEFFLEASAVSQGSVRKRLHPLTLAALRAYDWPGNIRELQNEMERLTVLAKSEEVIPPALLSPKIKQVHFGDSAMRSSLEAAIASVERQFIADGLRRNKWNKSHAAKELGMSRTSLIEKIGRYGLERRQRRRKAV